MATKKKAKAEEVVAEAPDDDDMDDVEDEDLDVVEEWLVNPHGPLVLDVKVNPTICAEWLEEAFRAG